MTSDTERTPSATPFDPTRHLQTERGRTWLPFKWRLYWLRDRHPDAELTTELLYFDARPAPDGYAVFRASVKLPGGGTAAAHVMARTDPKDPEWFQKAESKAAGRALRWAGFADISDDPGDDDQAKAGRSPAAGAGPRDQRAGFSSAGSGTTTSRPAANGAGAPAPGAVTSRLGAVAPAANSSGAAGGLTTIADPSPAAAAALQLIDAVLAGPTAAPAPVAAAAPPPPPPAASISPVAPPAPASQVQGLYSFADKILRWNPEDLDEHCRGLYGREPRALTKAEASEFLTHLRAMASDQGDGSTAHRRAR